MERAELIPAPGERRLYEFGEFRVDPVRRRLLRDGEPIAVTSKAFSLLVVLLERRGEVVEKEELFRRVWPDTYVTEANLTQNVSSLRKALGDRTGDRRFIVTVPGRGYSFVAHVREVSCESSGIFPIFHLEEPRLEEPPRAAFPVAVPEPPEPPEDVEDTKPPEETLAVTAAEPEAQPWRARRTGLPLLGIALLLVLAAASLLLGRPEAPLPRTPPPRELSAAGEPHRPAVVVLGFKDAGNPKTAAETAWLGIALSEMLSTELSAGRQARLISGESVTRVRQSISAPDTGNLRETDLMRLRTILGADLVVVGSYLVLDRPGGRLIRLDVRALELPGGAEVAALSETGQESDLFEIVSQAGAGLRQKLGLEELSPGQVRAVQAVHPSVPEAARLAAQGLERLRAFDPVRARDLLEKAAEIEPGSAAIHSLLAKAWNELGDDARSLQEARQALELSRSLPREERLAIEARFHAAGKQWPQAVEVYRSLWTFFPDDIDHGLQLAAESRGPRAPPGSGRS
jgi:DNA-binding winged helix-turn-helix (wHTH) protein